MREPNLEEISDYDTLKGQKKKVVWAVIFTGLIMGIVYSVAYNFYDNKEDAMNVQETIKSVPVK